jgi:GxxExxY protein
MDENDLTYKIRGAIFRVYNNLGPGLLESVYEAALIWELRKDGLDVKKQQGINVMYEEEELELGFRIDVLVNDQIIIEIKSVECLAAVHHKQLLTYLRLSNELDC